MDDLDRRILSLLREDARASFTDLARSVGTSEGTVRGRVRRLVADGTIQQFTIRTQSRSVKALVDVDITQNVQTKEVSDAIAGWEGVEAVWEVTGNHDLVVVADCPSTADLNDLIDRIRDTPGTRSTRSRLVLRES